MKRPLSISWYNGLFSEHKSLLMRSSVSKYSEKPADIKKRTIALLYIRQRPPVHYAIYPSPVSEVRTAFSATRHASSGSRHLPRGLSSVASRPPMNILSAINSNSAVTRNPQNQLFLHPSSLQVALHHLRRLVLLSLQQQRTGNKQTSTSSPLSSLMFSLVPQMSSVLCESYFASRYGIRTITTRRMKARPPHNRALKEVEKKKKEAKRDLRLARKRGSSADVVQSPAHHFITLVRAHSKLKKASNTRSMTRDVKTARERCHKDFRRCAREVLDGGLGQEAPTFGEEAATAFLVEVYHCDPRNFAQPEWMPTPSLPEVEFDCSRGRGGEDHQEDEGSVSTFPL